MPRSLPTTQPRRPGNRIRTRADRDAEPGDAWARLQPFHGARLAHPHLFLAAARATGLLTALPATTASAAPSGKSGDFNGDGYRDVAIAAPAATAGGGKSWAGQVAVVFGTANGLNPDKRTLISQNTAGIPDSAETDDGFGSQIATADLNLDGYADLVIGTPEEDSGRMKSAGIVVIVWGSRPDSLAV